MNKKESQEMKALFGDVHLAGGSLRVNATIGKTTWPTSLFWSRRGYYLLAVKAEVRKQERLEHGDAVSVAVEIRDV